MKKLVFALVLFAAGAARAAGPLASTIYTAPDASAGGGITLSVDAPLTFAVAVERDRQRVFKGTVGPDGLAVRFEHLPTGKYDLVLMSRNRNVFEGLELGGDPRDISETSMKNLRDRVATGDGFFNRWEVHRIGLSEETALVFVERIRDKKIYQQSSETLNSNLRRFEILELHRATDTWQVGDTRHLYREEEPVEPNPPFFKHSRVAELGGVRVIDQPKALGQLKLPSR